MILPISLVIIYTNTHLFDPYNSFKKHPNLIELDSPFVFVCVCVLFKTMSNVEGDMKNEMLDEKKRRRRISNKESARRSRIKKERHVQDLTFEMSRLRAENKEVVARIDEATKGYMMCEDENNVLRAQVAELSERLKYLNGLIGRSGVAVDGLGLSDTLLRPWQLPVPMQHPIPASSSGMLRF